MKTLILFTTGIILIAKYSYSQMPSPALIGYFQNWNSVNAPYIPLTQIDDRYNVIEVAFAIPKSGTDYDMEFIPQQISQSQFITQVQTVQSQGKKVLLSLGGGTAVVKLDNTSEKNIFISSVTSLINTYGFDGIDIDFEGTSVRVTSGTTIANPTDSSIVNLIGAIEDIMSNFRSNHNKKMLLTMAPETAYVQGGQSSYGVTRGAYLPIIDALRDSIDILQVQLYNSGDMYGVDRGIYTQGTTDFIVAMVDAVITGFNTQGGFFNGLPAHKVAVGLPACQSAAGGGFTDTTIVKEAIDYLRGDGAQPNQYVLQNVNGYPNLLGMMTWSINWDKLSTCGNGYEYAQNFEDIFLTPVVGLAEEIISPITIYPNPTQGMLNLINVPSETARINIYNTSGVLVFSQQTSNVTHVKLDVSDIAKGIYTMNYEGQKSNVSIRFIKID